MPLPGEIRTLADRILGRLNEAQDYYVHTRQAWRMVQQIVRDGHPVGIVDTGSGVELALRTWKRGRSGM